MVGVEAELLLQMLNETDDPAIRQQITEEFPADPELKGVFEKSYRGYLQAIGEERKKPKLLFRKSHGIAIAACMVLVVGAYLAMRIPQERIPSIPEETTTETIGTTMEISGEIPETGTAPTDIMSTDTIPPETEASSDMTEYSGEQTGSMTAPPMTDPVESTASQTPETSVTGDIPEETETIASSSEETDASIETSPMTTPSTTAATTQRTTEPTIESTEAPITGTTEETVRTTLLTEDMQTTAPTAPTEWAETTAVSTDNPTEETEQLATTGAVTTECAECTQNPTEEETTTTTTTTTDYQGVSGYALNRTTFIVCRKYPPLL